MKYFTIKKIVCLLAIFIFTLIFVPKSTYGADVEESIQADNQELTEDESEPTILINEIFYDPLGDEANQEWVELHNFSEEDIDLKDYTIISKSGSSEESFVFKSSAVIGSKEFFVLSRNGSSYLETNGFKAEIENFSISLANYGDYLVLRDSDGKEVDAVVWGTSAYGNIVPHGGVKPGSSLERASLGIDTNNCQNDFVEVFMPGPGREHVEAELMLGDNYVDAEDGEEIDSIKEISAAKLEQNGMAVGIMGNVTVGPNILSETYFYIQDKNSGIQIYCYGKSFPKLKEGDLISVTGELTEVNNERRLRIRSEQDITVLEQATERPVIPEGLKITDLNEKKEGCYVKVKGKVIQTSGNVFYVSDGSASIKIVINSNTNIKKPSMRQGYLVEVAGILSQYKDYYRLLPFKQEDVKIIDAKDSLPETGGGIITYIVSSFATIFLWNSFQKTKKILKKLLKNLQARQNLGIFLRYSVILAVAKRLS